MVFVSRLLGLEFKWLEFRRKIRFFVGFIILIYYIFGIVIVNGFLFTFFDI